MAREFKVKAVLTAEDKASGPIRKAQGAFSGFASFLSSRFVITAGDAFRAVQAGFESMRDTITLQAQERALAAQLAGAGASLDGFLDKLKEVSDGTVATADLISSSSRALLLGIPADEIASLLEVARASAAATGETTAKAFDDITTGIGRASPLILDNLGLVIRLEDAYAEMATQLGKGADELTEAEKKQALLNKVLAVGKDRIDEFGDAAGGLKAKLEQAEAATQNLSTAVEKVVAAFGEGVLSGASFGDESETLTDSIEDSAGAFRTAGTFLSLYLAELANGRPVYSAVAEAQAQLAAATEQGAVANQKALEAQAKNTQQKEKAKAASEAVAAATAAEKKALDQLTASLQLQADGYEAALTAASAFGEVTSAQLSSQIAEISLALEAQKEILGANSDEYVRLEEVASQKIESLNRRIESLRRGQGDLAESTETLRASYDDFGRTAESAAASVETLTRATQAQATVQANSVAAAQRASSAVSFNSRGQLGGGGGLFPGLSGGVFQIRVPTPTVSPNGRVAVNP